jgi:hypothetical protein
MSSRGSEGMGGGAGCRNGGGDGIGAERRIRRRITKKKKTKRGRR